MTKQKDFQVGDRVCVWNKLSYGSGESELARKATVKKVEVPDFGPKIIHFETDCGKNRWRHRENLNELFEVVGI